jgi:transcriptional regulator with XRE-family HTH domain
MRDKYFPEISIGARIRELRKAKGLTQKQFADALGIVQGFLSGIEQGKKPINATLLYAICHRYAVSEEWLLQGVGSPGTIADAGSRSIPLLKQIPDTFPQQVGPLDVATYLTLPDSPPSSFAIRAQGDFMAPTIRDGDLVLFVPDSSYVNRNIVLLTSRWGEVILRRCRIKGEELFFSPENAVYAPFKADESTRILGTVVAIWRQVPL